MATSKAVNYTKAQEDALRLAFKHITSMTDAEKRAEVEKQSLNMSKVSRSIISKLGTMDGAQWVPYAPKAASSVKRGPSRQERLNIIVGQLGLKKASLQSLSRALADDLLTLSTAITNLVEGQKVAAKAEAS